ncbi:peptide/nickel transport system substrate-binding protein [Paenarthrobacter nicotinovorans]|uniref:Peptide/nickel transport system substrate-binding protein n=1 Tax=Paenarthrobacter nicotinovorans TaxID=29320 RepID=A0ABT9TLU1_PAENI|nr:ABC transporter substrate-binding protein [Paenarthrobacter nicotinovorans]MDQ0102621.1 peptide/nickel transport system substrate-binding protein [Paenarthrobacter nicotinovorans]
MSVPNHPAARKLRKPAAVVSVLGVFALLASACAGGADAGTQQSAVATPVSGGNLNFAVSVDRGCIDPQQVGNNDAIAIARQTVASLTSQDPKTGEIVPWLAEKFETNTNATSFTFTLRSGATFADGTAIDAASVKTNFEAIKALGAKATLGSTYLSDVSAITVKDPQTVVVDFSKPNAQFLQATSTFTLGLLSPASATLSEADRCAGKFSGSGPFSVKSYTVDKEAVLERRAGYNWPAATNSNKGEAYLDTVTFKIIPEAGNRTGSLQSGQIDATAAISAADISLFNGNGFWNETRANPGVVYNLYANQSNPKLKEAAVRQAISKAINREEITKTLLTEADQPAKGVLSHTTPYFKDYSELLKHDPDGAKKLLDDAGWKEGADGIREKNGEKLSFKVTYWQSPKEVLELVQQQLKVIGVDLQLKFTTIADVTAAQADKTYDFSYGNLTRSDPDVLRTVFASTTARGGSNLREKLPVDDVLGEQAAALDKDARQKLVDEAQEILIKDAHSIPLYELSTTISASEHVKGLTFEASSRLDFYDAWLSK